MKRIISITVAMLLLGVSTAFAELSAKQIVIRSKVAIQGSSSVNKIKMTVTNKRGDEQVQKMITRTKTVNGLNQQISTFLYPDETKGTKFLKIEKDNQNDIMKIYIPDLGKPRTISSSQRKQSFMGSDFTYEDLEALQPQKGQHSIFGNNTFEDAPCYVIQTNYSGKKSAGYSKTLTWIRKDNYLPVKTEYYDKDANLIKVKTAHEIYKKKDVWVLKKLVMKNVQKNHQTVIEVVESKIQPVNDSYFTEQFLRQTDKY
jgi:hypothetical protein